MQKLPVIKIEIEGWVTSFRYPHFMQGMQPTYDMPPPSTIYGHLCSAVGDWIEPTGLRFGYFFTHDGKFIDYKEHLHFDDPIQPFPFNRELLFHPRLTLYIDRLDLLDSLRQPHYSVCLGRSQDLVTYRSIEVIELDAANEGYFEQTLLPLAMAPRLDRNTIAVTMASYINPRRQPTWQTYIVLNDKAIWPPSPQKASGFDDEEELGSGLIFEGDDNIELWIDPYSPTLPKSPHLRRLVWFHSFKDG